MHRVIYRPAALSDLESIFAYIAKDNLHYAEEVLSRIERSVTLLESFPLIGTEIQHDIRMLVEQNIDIKSSTHYTQMW